jgi:hypothetical protein
MQIPAERFSPKTEKLGGSLLQIRTPLLEEIHVSTEPQ